jgi:hypothetical protein
VTEPLQKEFRYDAKGTCMMVATTVVFFGEFLQPGGKYIFK